MVHISRSAPYWQGTDCEQVKLPCISPYTRQPQPIPNTKYVQFQLGEDDGGVGPIKTITWYEVVIYGSGECSKFMLGS